MALVEDRFLDIRKAKSIAETHCHTVASSHAYSTILENIAYAKKNGMCAVAITEHCPQMPDGPHIWFFENLLSVNRMIDDTIMLRGAEADIISYEGGLDLPDRILEQLDWVIASFHFPLGIKVSVDEYTKAYIEVAKNKNVHVIGHCGTEAFRFDYERGIKAFKEYNKIVEINAHSFTVRKGAAINCVEIAKLCKKYEVPVVVSADAHIALEIGGVQPSLDLLADIDFPEHLILNIDKDRFFDSLERYCGLKAHDLK